MTVEGIARLAKVGKPTIYRHWPNAAAVSMAALLEQRDVKSVGKSAQGMAGLRLQLRTVAKAFATSMGRNVTMLVASSEPDTELARVFRHHFINTRREEGRRYLSQAIALGEIRGDVKIEIVLDLIYAPVFYRLLLGHDKLTPRYMDQVLEHAVMGLDPP